MGNSESSSPSTTWSLPQPLTSSPWLTAAALTAGTAAGGLILLTMRRRARWTPGPGRAVLLTGCDRGLGFSLALHCRRLGLTVLAGVLDERSAGAQRLAQLGPGVRVLPLDVTDPASVRAALLNVKQALRDDPELQLAALVNNAGVMVFGEFGWQTEPQVEAQLDVNLKGTMRVTRAFLPLLRGHGRVVVVTSHCALASLPGLSVYAATKAGLQGWADSLRMEQAQYGVGVVQLVPGSFVHQTGILAGHADQARLMMSALSAEDRDFYGDYPERFHAYLEQVAVLGEQASASPEPLPDPRLHQVFEDALLSLRPAHRYVHEPLRYKLYHGLYKVAPESARDWLMIKFACLPAFRQK